MQAQLAEQTKVLEILRDLLTTGPADGEVVGGEEEEEDAETAFVLEQMMQVGKVGGAAGGSLDSSPRARLKVSNPRPHFSFPFECAERRPAAGSDRGDHLSSESGIILVVARPLRPHHGRMSGIQFAIGNAAAHPGTLVAVYVATVLDDRDER